MSDINTTEKKNMCRKVERYDCGGFDCKFFEQCPIYRYAKECEHHDSGRCLNEEAKKDSEKFWPHTESIIKNEEAERLIDEIFSHPAFSATTEIYLLVRDAKTKLLDVIAPKCGQRIDELDSE